MAKARPARSKGGGWVTTFADLMALLLTFFILMMTFSTIEVEKYEAMVASFSKGFKSIGILTGSQGVLSGQDAVSIVPAVVDTPSGGSGEATLDQPELTIGEAADTTISPEQYSLYRQFSYALDEQIGDGSVSIGLGEGGLTLRFEERAAFPRGGAELSERLADILETVGAVLEKTDAQIIVSGHTDDLAVPGEYRSKWDLSAARAVSVVQYLLSAADIPPEKIVPQGRADSRPLYPNLNDNFRARNRRVEITVID